MTCQLSEEGTGPSVQGGRLQRVVVTVLETEVAVKQAVFLISPPEVHNQRQVLPSGTDHPVFRKHSASSSFNCVVYGMACTRQYKRPSTFCQWA